MSRNQAVLLAAVALLACILALRLCRHDPPSPPAEPPSVMEWPDPPPPPPSREPPRRVASGVPQRPPDRLLPFLERIGRAKLVRDRRRLAELRAAFPPLFKTDVAWLKAQLEGSLFAAAGAAEMIRAFGLQGAIPELSAALSRRTSHPFLKNIVIDVMSSLGGDAAASALLTALQSDPDASIRLRVARGFGRPGLPGAHQALSTALRDPSPEVRSAASNGLSRLGLPSAIEIIMEALEQESDPAVSADLVSSAYALGGPSWRKAVVDAIRSRPDTAAELRRRINLQNEARYRPDYAREFFEAGGVPVPFVPPGRRIGITVELKPEMKLEEVAEAMFAPAPFDRYRDWFYLRRAEEFPSPKAYDSHGRSMGDLPPSNLDATVYVRFEDPDHFDKGVLGYTRGCKAFVMGASLLHELGHAFSMLADEYPEGSTRPAPNISREVPAPWDPLIRSGRLPEPFARDDDFYVPAETCHMNNNAVGTTSFCPVCQLEIHARIAELSGATPPW